MTTVPENQDSRDSTSSSAQGLTESEKQSQYAESIQYSQFALKQSLRAGLTALAVITIISVMVWGAIDNLPGIYGVLLAAGIGGAFLLTTLVVVLLTAKASPQMMFATLLGSWLVKIVIFFLIMMYLRNQTFYNKTAFIVTLFLVVIAVAGLEIFSLLRAPQSYTFEKLSEPDGSQVDQGHTADDIDSANTIDRSQSTE